VRAKSDAIPLSLAPGFSPVFEVAEIETVLTVSRADEEAVETAGLSSFVFTPG
jgi:hypothetical protein